MKLICLNILGGKIYEPLLKFIREEAPSTDIFCFQEVFRSPRKDIEISRDTRINILDELASALPDFDYVFHPIVTGIDENGPVDFDIEFGQAEFVKKSINIISSGDIPTHFPKSEFRPDGHIFLPANFGYFRIIHENKNLTIINVHGLTSSKDDKLDMPIRIEQSRIIKEFAQKEKDSAIIIGDFNILPEAKSITTFEDGFRDLIKEYGIQCTRSRLSRWHGLPGEFKFSDYAFVSPGLKISKFEVPNIEISDHLPLILEF